MTCKILTDRVSLPSESFYIPKSHLRSYLTIDPLRWRETLPQLGVFDLIFLHHLLPIVDEKAAPLLRTGQEVVQKIKEICPDLITIRYSDQDLDAFCEAGAGGQRYLSRFLTELRDGGQITSEQYQRVAEKYQLERQAAPPKPQADPLFPLIQECLKNHMRKGSKLICILRPPHSRYEDPQFFEHIITNPSLHYEEKTSERETLITIESISAGEVNAREDV